MTEMSEELKRYYKLVKARPELFVQKGALELILDEQEILKFEKKGGRKIGVRYQSPYNMMVVDLVKDDNGDMFAYERIIQTVDAPSVVVFPIFNNKIALTYQFRHSVRGARYALPRGFGSKGKTAVENADKEVFEEIGGVSKKSILLGEVEADTGLTATKVSVVCCDLESLDCELGIEGIAGVLLVAPDELAQMIAHGEITDGFTLSAWALYQAKMRYRK